MRFIASRLKYREASVMFGDTKLRLLLADTFLKNAIGLMYRDSIPLDGMLFIIKRKSRQGIWMKNMRFPIDIIWVYKDGRVCDIAHSVSPCKGINCKVYRPWDSVSFVIELSSGKCKRLGISKDSKLEVKTG